MQPSRMFNAGAMRDADLMREVAAMRLADGASRSAAPTTRMVSPVGSLAHRVASWRRLSTLRLFGGHREAVVTGARPSGA